MALLTRLMCVHFLSGSPAVRVKHGVSKKSAADLADVCVEVESPPSMAEESERASVNNELEKKKHQRRASTQQVSSRNGRGAVIMGADCVEAQSRRQSNVSRLQLVDMHLKKHLQNEAGERSTRRSSVLNPRSKAL